MDVSMVTVKHPEIMTKTTTTMMMIMMIVMTTTTTTAMATVMTTIGKLNIGVV